MSTIQISKEQAVILKELVKDEIAKIEGIEDKYDSKVEYTTYLESLNYLYKLLNQGGGK